MPKIYKSNQNSSTDVGVLMKSQSYLRNYWKLRFVGAEGIRASVSFHFAVINTTVKNNLYVNCLFHHTVIDHNPSLREVRTGTHSRKNLKGKNYE